MMKVYKYPIRIVDSQRITMHPGKVVHVGEDPTGQACLWVEVDTEQAPVPMVVNVFGTGHELTPHRGNHLGTFVAGPFVWHVYSQSLSRKGMP